MPNNAGFGQRAREARRRWAVAHDAELTYGEIGIAVARFIGRDKPYSHQAVRRWFVDGQEPDSLDAMAGLAAALEVDPSWLAFGPPAPTSVPVYQLDDEPEDVTPRPAEEHRRRA